MEVSRFTDRLNKVNGKVYVIEELIYFEDGLYERELQHDNINMDSVSVYTGSKLTGKKIETYTLSTPSLTPWKKIIKIYSSEEMAYITYETTGDTVEADDINKIQVELVLTQTELNAETNRAITAETQLQSNLDAYTTVTDGEIQGLKAKDLDLDNKKASVVYVNVELNKRYTKDETYTKAEILKKIEDLIGSAPETLDTFKEIANALGDDPNFSATIMTALSQKVDKVTGKQLSTNDYSNAEKALVADANAKKHEHANSTVINSLTQPLVTKWDTVINKVDKIPGKELSTNDYTTADKSKLASIATNANNYVHPDKHPPSIISQDSSNRFVTDAMIEKLGNIEASAQVNAQSDWNEAGITSDSFIKNKPKSLPASDVSAWAKANVKPTYGWGEITGKPTVFPPSGHTHSKVQITDMPTKLSEFINDSGYLKESDLDVSTNHVHGNKVVIDKITDPLLVNWNKAYSHLADHDSVYLKKGKVTWNDLKGV